MENITLNELLLKSEELIKAYTAMNKSVLKNEFMSRICQCVYQLITLFIKGIPRNIDEDILVRVSNIGKICTNASLQAKLLSLILNEFEKIQEKRLENAKTASNFQTEIHTITEKSNHGSSSKPQTSLENELKKEVLQKFFEERKSELIAHIKSFKQQQNIQKVSCAIQTNPKPNQKSPPIQKLNPKSKPKATTKNYQKKPFVSKPTISRNQNNQLAKTQQPKSQAYFSQRQIIKNVPQKSPTIIENKPYKVKEKLNQKSAKNLKEQQSGWIGINSPELDDDALWTKM